MMAIYHDNPYYNLLICYLITYRLTEVNFNKKLFLKLGNNAQQELNSILRRNHRLMLLELHNPGFSDKKIFSPTEYYYLKKKNAKLIGIEIKPPTLFDLCAQTLSVYATKQGLFDSPRIKIDRKNKKLSFYSKKQLWYGTSLFSKKHNTSTQKIPEEVFERFMNIYKEKTTMEKIIEKYHLLNVSYLIRGYFSFNQNNVDYIVNFLLECATHNNDSDFRKVTPKIIRRGNFFTENVYLADTLCGINPLHIACELDAPIILIEQLIASGGTIKGGTIFTPLHQACLFNSSIELIDKLLEHEANIESIATRFKLTPLHIACHLGNDTLALQLLQRGANMKAVVHSSISLDFVERYCCNANALHLALMAGCKIAAMYMIENNSDFSQVTKGKVHAFHLVCQYGVQSMVKALCEKLKDPVVMDQDNLNPADYALMNPNLIEKTSILEILKNFHIEPTQSETKINEILTCSTGESNYYEYSSSTEANFIGLAGYG